MGLVVNTNVSSINAQNNLLKIQKSMSTSLERLSSGLRINHSSDDAAGLAIATGMRSQVQGLQQAVRNAGDGLSALTTADGAIAEETTILQRIRVLAVQAANEVNSSENLSSIQEEINQEIDELTRIGQTTDFNGQNLINGTFTNKSIQVGAFADQTIEISIEDFRATDMGAFAKVTGAQGSLSANSIITGAGASNVAINGVDIGATISDGISYDTDGANGLGGAATTDDMDARSAIAKANAINAVTSQTGVTATVGATVLSGTTAIGGGAIGADDQMSINGVMVIDGGVVGMGSGITTTAADGSFAVRDLINAQSNQTGVVATYDTTADRLVLTAEDGRNITVDANSVTGGFVGFTNADGNDEANAATHSAAGTITLASNNNIQLDMDHIDQLGLNVSTQSAITTDSTKIVANIDVTTDGGAADAIRSVDSAIAKITSEQAKIGAQVNRFEHVISNLGVAIENMSAAESRIRDTDFAMETANLTRTQIIQQAGTAMLSQANMRPQAALSLLG